ncbi:fumarylacetoacetate hydrolase family protein [Azospirillum rugosum]|uniref:2-keto-4-pentenoate hydratase n=1 Tax=Azospirillum rugosum TaxID=416170 RepID=A0ABS4T0H0_9PROT|nr:fumarylacetoacetate hydrolase family protein [Azospirillum rugosum]MBP2297145.1 2-keto-4-pentenoate hydratase [Azospirillum rugosum]MDQ0530949.1 2-keto-4-pentenoate hydratase [Azospirillum rugosum]
MDAVTTVTPEAVRKAADRLFEAGRTGIPVSPVRELIGPCDVDVAYQVQELNTKRALEAGRRLVGRKIGLTSLAVQKQLGVDQPDYGMLFADMARSDGEEISLKDLMQPKVEAEIAFVLERDLESDQPTFADLFLAIAYAVPAVEIVGSRIANWDIKISDTIADNASSGLYVLGSMPRRLDAGGFDLRGCEMMMEKAGLRVSTGAGAACLGSPLNAALWLARIMARTGRPLRAGDTVLSGALGPMVPVIPGDEFDVHIDGLGCVRAAFAKE